MYYYTFDLVKLRVDALDQELLRTVYVAFYIAPRQKKLELHQGILCARASCVQVLASLAESPPRPQSMCIGVGQSNRKVSLLIGH